MKKFLIHAAITLGIIGAGFLATKAHEHHMLPFQEHIDQHKPHIVLYKKDGKKFAYILDYRPAPPFWLSPYPEWTFKDKDGFTVETYEGRTVVWKADEFEVPDDYEIIDCRR